MASIQDYIHSQDSSSVLFAHKASLLLSKERVDEALELCEQGVKRFPFYTEGYVVLGRCYQMKGLTEKAIKAFNRALLLQPNHVKALKGLAYLYYKMGEKRKGEHILLRAFLYAPVDRELYEFLKSENLTQNLYQHPRFVDAESGESKNEPLVIKLDEVLDEGRISDEEERRNLLEQIESKGPKEEGDENERLLDLESSAFDLESTLLTPEAADDFVPEDLTDVMPDTDDLLTESGEELKEHKQPGPESPLPETGEIKKDQEEFTVWMKNLFEAEDEEPRQESKTQNKKDEAGKNLDTAMIFASKKVDDSESAQEETPVRGNKVSEDLERITPEESRKVEAGMAEEKESETELDRVIQELGQREKKKKDSAQEALPVSEDEEVGIEQIINNPSLLTPTFGEILIAQRKFADALKVFQTLAQREPDNPRFQKKIEFLTKLVSAQR